MMKFTRPENRRNRYLDKGRELARGSWEAGKGSGGLKKEQSLMIYTSKTVTMKPISLYTYQNINF